MSLPNAVAWATSLLPALGLDSAHVVGESRGGGVAIRLAYHDPKLVRSLILFSTIGLPPNELPKPDQKPETLGFGYDEWAWFVERSFEDPTVASDELRGAIEKDIAKSQDYETRRNAAITDDYNRFGLLREIVALKQPTLLFWGRQDPVFPVECVGRFRSLLQNLEEYVILEEARHLAFYEHSDVVNERMLEFLEGQNGKNNQ